MPSQNRVTPFGEIVAVSERGTVMGNRGRLHDERGRIRRAWQVARWLLCRLEFNGRYRTVMAPNRYTELFFLDEATGIGGRASPVFRVPADNPSTPTPMRGPPEIREYCRSGRPTVAMIDGRLHAERVGPERSKRTFLANLDDLPDGVFVTLEGRDGDPYLIRVDELLAWSPAGNHERRSRPEG